MVHADDATTAKLVSEWDARAWLRVLRYDKEPEELAVECGGTADQWVVPGGARAHLWPGFDGQSSHVLVAERFDVLRGRVTAIVIDPPSFGISATALVDGDKILCNRMLLSGMKVIDTLMDNDR